MRCILVETARRKSRGSGRNNHHRVPLEDVPAAAGDDADTILAIDEAVTRLSETDSSAAEIVKLHIFGGLTLDEAADALGVSHATACRHWTYARAHLRQALRDRQEISRRLRKIPGIRETLRGVSVALVMSFRSAPCRQLPVPTR